MNDRPTKDQVAPTWGEHIHREFSAEEKSQHDCLECAILSLINRFKFEITDFM